MIMESHSEYPVCHPARIELSLSHLCSSYPAASQSFSILHSPPSHFPVWSLCLSTSSAQMSLCCGHHAHPPVLPRNELTYFLFCLKKFSLSFKPSIGTCSENLPNHQPSLLPGQNKVSLSCTLITLLQQYFQGSFGRYQPANLALENCILFICVSLMWPLKKSLRIKSNCGSHDSSVGSPTPISPLLGIQCSWALLLLLRDFLGFRCETLFISLPFTLTGNKIFNRTVSLSHTFCQQY